MNNNFIMSLLSRLQGGGQGMSQGRPDGVQPPMYGPNDFPMNMQAAQGMGHMSPNARVSDAFSQMPDASGGSLAPAQPMGVPTPRPRPDMPPVAGRPGGPSVPGPHMGRPGAPTPMPMPRPNPRAQMIMDAQLEEQPWWMKNAMMQREQPGGQFLNPANAARASGQGNVVPLDFLSKLFG